MKISKLEEGTLIREPYRYISFPYLAKDKYGKVLMTYRKASKFSYTAAINDLTTHHDPKSEIFVCEVDLQTKEKIFVKNNNLAYKSDYGVNDPSITITNDGNYLLRFVALDIYPINQYKKKESTKIFSHRAEHGLVTNIIGQIVLKSEDGKTWDYLSTVESKKYGLTCGRDPIIELEDSSLIMPGYFGAPERSDVCVLHRSFDKGKTWSYTSIIAIDSEGEYSQLHGINFNEASLVNLGNGHLLAAIRGDTTFYTSNDTFMPVGGVGKIYLCYSHDGGLCWSKPFDIGIFGQPANLIEDSKGRLVMTYGYRKEPYGVKVAISENNGKNWDFQEFLSREFDLWDCGYPSTLEIEPNKFLSVFYGADKEKTRGIEYVKWELI